MQTYQTYDELLELARICARNARLPMTTKVVAAELWKMAKDYQARAAQLDSGNPPDIGPPPEFNWQR
jgi:hypothetical protein